MTQSGARLFLTYAVASLIPIIALGAVLMWHDNRAGSNQALRQAEGHANVIMQMAISPALDRRPLMEGLTWKEREGLWAATDLAIYTRSIAAIKLRSFDGAVIFADNNARSDLLDADSEDFQAAVHGRTVARVVPHPYDPSALTVRVLQPIIPTATGQSTGVMQLYLPYDSVAESIRSQQRETQLYLAGGLGLLYLVLAAISWSTSSRLHRYAERQKHAARHDALTGVPNRGWFQEQVTNAIASRDSGAIVVIDLDRFKEINDSAGHSAGDTLLVAVAQRMSEYVRGGDTVARIGGDEFGILLPDVKTDAEAIAILGRIVEEMKKPVRIGDFSVAIGASFGVAIFPDHGNDLSTLLHRADVAMYYGKRTGEPIVIWSPQIPSPSPEAVARRSE